MSSGVDAAKPPPKWCPLRKGITEIKLKGVLRVVENANT